MLAMSGALFAELPPWVYKERQDKAPEALVIKVRSVTKKETTEERWKRIDFTVQAELEKVKRSATNLAAGTTITIQYSRREHFQPIVGPSEVPVLKEGQTYTAYLSADAKVYTPAAGGQSFETGP